MGFPTLTRVIAQFKTIRKNRLFSYQNIVLLKVGFEPTKAYATG